MNNIRADHASNQSADSETDAPPEVALGANDGTDEGTNDTEQPDPQSFQSALGWLGFNLILFQLYVGFFHLCLVTKFPISLAIGLVIAAVMSYLCVRFYRLFANRYEFLFYLALPLDVVMESLVAEHSGYSFYWCALGFWTVFVLYRVRCVLSGGTNASLGEQVSES